MTMITKAIQLEFATPAFLGGANQSGEWRVPPFKALLRQWWRVARAGQLGYSPDCWKQIREEEGRLFGHAWLKNNGDAWASRSQVQLSLGEWQPGNRSSWLANDPGPVHPEVGDHGRPVGATLYLGYGPLNYSQGSTRLKTPPAIDAHASSTLKLRFPASFEPEWAVISDLWHWFGTIGGRSRNGWGSLRIATQPNAIPSRRALTPVLRPLSDCLKLQWPHAIGSASDGRPLVWLSRQPFTSWELAMKHLAEIKISFRTALGFAGTGLSKRHFLGYPITHHNIHSWGNNARLANQLRFKVIQESPGVLRCLAFHLPHSLPSSLRQSLPEHEKRNVDHLQLEAWQTVHRILSENMEQLP